MRRLLSANAGSVPYVSRRAIPFRIVRARFARKKQAEKRIHGNLIMANEPDKSDTPPAPETPPASPPAAKTDKPPEKRKFSRDDRGPRKRTRDAVPSLQ